VNINYMGEIPLWKFIESCLNGRLSYIAVIRIVEFTEVRWQ
jgi:hypothetical protein